MQQKAIANHDHRLVSELIGVEQAGRPSTIASIPYGVPTPPSRYQIEAIPYIQEMVECDLSIAQDGRRHTRFDPEVVALIDDYANGIASIFVDISRRRDRENTRRRVFPLAFALTGLYAATLGVPDLLDQRKSRRSLTGTADQIGTGFIAWLAPGWDYVQRGTLPLPRSRVSQARSGTRPQLPLPPHSPGTWRSI